MKIAFLARARPDLPSRIPADIDYAILEVGQGNIWNDSALGEVSDADAFVVSMEPVNAQLLRAAGQLQIVQRLGVGYETLDLKSAAKRGIPCCNIEGVNKEAVAEHGMNLMLALARRILETDSLTRDGRWDEARGLTQLVRELRGKTLGVIGLGNTGSQLAIRAKAMGMKILYNDIRDMDPEVLEKTGATFASKEQLFSQSNVVSVNTDLNETSAGMIGVQALGQMHKNTIFICCARGGIVDEPALTNALNQGAIAAAGIDVFETEPVLADNPLLKAKNCIVTAHVAGITDETTQRIFDWAIENVRRVVERGEKPQWVRNGV